MIRVRHLFLILLPVVGCSSSSDVPDDVTALKGPAASSETGHDRDVVEVDWSALGSCALQLKELRRRHAAGEQLDPGTVPVAVVRSPGGPTVPLRADLPIPIATAAGRQASCVLRVGTARDVASQRRIAGRETVTSEYQQGVRREDNPAYALAKAKVDMAKRQAGYDDEVWTSVGDPMVDLVGLLVGSIVEGFSEGAREDELNEAMLDLAKTPRKVDQPVYATYHFDRVIIEASRRGVIPVELVDLRHGTASPTTIQQAEHRRFHIPQGLSERDRDYAGHVADSISPQDLNVWLRSPPELSLSRLVQAVLGETPRGGPADRFAPGSDQAVPEGGDEPSFGFGLREADALEDTAAVAAEEPDTILFDTEEARAPLRAEFHQPFRASGRSELVERAPTAWSGGSSAFASEERRPSMATPTGRARARQADGLSADPRFASVVVIRRGSSVGSGFYVSPHVVATNYHVVEGATLVDIVNLDGTRVMGMVVATDLGRDLALLHTPDPGPPVTLYAGPELRPGATVDAIGAPHGHDFTLTRGIVSAVRMGSSLLVPGMQRVRYIQTDAAINEGNSGGPLFLGDELVGVNDWAETGAVSGGLNFAIHVDELRAFLDEEGVARSEEPRPVTAGNG